MNKKPILQKETLPNPSQPTMDTMLAILCCCSLEMVGKILSDAFITLGTILEFPILWKKFYFYNKVKMVLRKVIKTFIFFFKSHLTLFLTSEKYTVHA